MPPRKLAVVPDGTTLVPPPESIYAATEVSERAVLVALRKHLSQEMDKGAVPAHALASVGAKIREYDRDIRALDAQARQEAT